MKSLLPKNRTTSISYSPKPFFQKKGEGIFLPRSGEIANSFFKPAHVQTKVFKEEKTAKHEPESDSTINSLDQNAHSALEGLDIFSGAGAIRPQQATPKIQRKGDPGAGDRTEAHPQQPRDEQPNAAETEEAEVEENAQETEGEGCAQPSDQAGILALITRAGAGRSRNNIAYGFTFLAPNGIVQPKVEIDWTRSGNQWTGTVKRTSTSMGQIEALFLEPGTYKGPKKVTAHGPNCGPQGKKVDFFSKVDQNISDLAKMAEQEHCNDYQRAFNLSYGKWAAIINSIAGQAFGPGSKRQVRAKITQELQAKGDKGRNHWVREYNRLTALSLQRDQGDHAMKSDGAPVTVDAGCTRIDATSVKGPSTKIPGPSSASLIN